MAGIPLWQAHSFAVDDIDGALNFKRHASICSRLKRQSVPILKPGITCWRTNRKTVPLCSRRYFAISAAFITFGSDGESLRSAEDVSSSGFVMAQIVTDVRNLAKPGTKLTLIRRQ